MAATHQEMQFKGLAASSGVALARICMLSDHRHKHTPHYEISQEHAAGERERLAAALAEAVAQVEILVARASERLGSAHAGIFRAQQMMLEDPTLREQMFQHLATHSVNAEQAVIASLDVFERALSEVDNQYLQDRVSDVVEMKRRLLGILGDLKPALACHSGGCLHGRNRIICAEELTSSMTMEMDVDRVVGFLTERGGVGSHAAILARALGIPAVTGVKGIFDALTCGTEVLLDGGRGEVIVWPGNQTKRRYPSAAQAARTVDVVPPAAGLAVFANISRDRDVEGARVALAEGIGLYRTEFELIAADRPLTEAEHLERYTHVMKAMDGRPVTFRLLDLGADKAPEFLALEPEQNPFLGLRGSRLLLARPDLLTAQARALAHASRLGPIDVLYPMIVDVQQFLRLRDAFNDAIRGIEIGTIRHGVMFEVPSACLQARELFEHAAFGSIGTNDLAQYLFAVDRGNEAVAADYDPERPVLWQVIATIAAAADAAGRPLSLCGELAGEAQYIERLMQIGIRRVSVSPRRIGAIRRAVHEHAGMRDQKLD